MEYLRIIASPLSTPPCVAEKKYIIFFFSLEGCMYTVNRELNYFNDKRMFDFNLKYSDSISLG